jgi:hypothetical protein
MAAIRRGVGDSYVVASGAPLLSMAGLAEGCRIGQDTATPVYDFETGRPGARFMGDEVHWIARNLACRHFLSGWFQLDPDVTLVGANLSLEQSRQLVTVAALSGGPFFNSDDLTGLDTARLALLTNPEILELVGGSPATPEWDPVNHALAAIWRRGDLLAAFNWAGPARRLLIETAATAPLQMRDLWRRQDIVLTDPQAGLELPESGVRVLRLKGDGVGTLRAWLE